MIDIRMLIARQCPIAAGRVGIEPTAYLYRDISRFLYRLDGEIAGRLDDDMLLATDPGDHCWPVLVIMATTGLAFLTPATRLASQRLLPAPFRLPLVAGGVVEVIG